MGRKCLDYSGLAYLLSKFNAKIQAVAESFSWERIVGKPDWMERAQTVGSSVQPVYIKDGVPTGMTGNVGSSSRPVYLKGGVLTECNRMIAEDSGQGSGGAVVWGDIEEKPGWMENNIGSSTKPVYVAAGVPMACGGSLAVDITGNAATATALKTARNLQVNLASSVAASFNGKANASIGVTGVLPVANGGTGASSLAGVTVGTANKLGTVNVGSASLPMYLNGGVPTACTAGSVFSALTSTSTTNLSVTVAGQSRSVSELYAAVVKTAVYASGNLYLAGATGTAAGYATLQKCAGHYINGDTIYSGNGLFTGYLTMYYTSDRRQKENVRPVNNAAERLMALGRVYDFDYKEKARVPYREGHVGLMYQEVARSMPGLTRQGRDGFGAINYIDPTLISLVVGAGQEHEKRIRDLEKRILQLEGRAA